MSKTFILLEKKRKGYINDKKHITDTTSNIPKDHVQPYGVYIRFSTVHEFVEGCTSASKKISSCSTRDPVLFIVIFPPFKQSVILDQSEKNLAVSLSGHQSSSVRWQCRRQEVIIDLRTEFNHCFVIQ